MARFGEPVRAVRVAEINDVEFLENLDFEVEVTMKLFRYRYRVYEIPITYTGRGYDEGKKITWKDGVHALWAILKWSLLARR